MDWLPVLATVSASLASLILSIVALWSAHESRSKVKAEKEKVESEKKKLDIEYWEGVAADLRREIREARAEYQLRIDNLTDAFDYLCQEVAHDYPMAVAIARKIAEGRMKFPRPKSNDPTEEHD